MGNQSINQSGGQVLVGVSKAYDMLGWYGSALCCAALRRAVLCAVLAVLCAVPFVLCVCCAVMCCGVL